MSGRVRVVLSNSSTPSVVHVSIALLRSDAFLDRVIQHLPSEATAAISRQDMRAALNLTMAEVFAEQAAHPLVVGP